MTNPMKTKKKDLLSLADLSIEDLKSLLKETAKVKKNPRKYSNRLSGKTLAMIFEKPSTRTRVSFEVAAVELGCYPLVLNTSDMQLGRGETIGDSAKVLSRYVDGVMARVYKHKTLVELAENSAIPIINGLSDLEHPCQIIADLYTISEFKRKQKIKLAYVGDGNNVCNSIILGCAMMGIDVAVAYPKGYEPDESIVQKAQRYSGKTKANVFVTNDPYAAVENADVVYTDVWVSMGDEQEKDRRMRVFSEYQVSDKLLEKADSECIVMHCLPAHRGQEITDYVLDGSKSVVWDQAENRLHTQKAILMYLM